MSAASLSHVGARAHGDANVGLLERRRIVDAVARQLATTSPSDCRRSTSLTCGSGLDAREERGPLGRLELLGGAQVVKLAARVALAREVLVRPESADLAADGLGRVAGCRP